MTLPSAITTLSLNSTSPADFTTKNSSSSEKLYSYLPPDQSPISQTPKDSIMHVFSFLQTKELENASSVCRSYHDVPDSYWEKLYHKNMKSESPYKYIPRLETSTYKKLAELQLKRNDEEVSSAVAIELGSYNARAGFCGDDHPIVTSSYRNGIDAV